MIISERYHGSTRKESSSDADLGHSSCDQDGVYVPLGTRETVPPGNSHLIVIVKSLCRV